MKGYVIFEKYYLLSEYLLCIRDTTPKLAPATVVPPFARVVVDLIVPRHRPPSRPHLSPGILAQLTL